VIDAPLLPVLLLGLLFGIQHATDPDHVIAVATIVARTRRFGAGALVGAFWGVGHTVTITTVGIALIAFNGSIPPRVGLFLELIVALMLIVLGIVRIVWVLRESALHSHLHTHDEAVHRHAHVHPPARLLRALQMVGPAQALRAALVGLVHGLAGSAAVALLVLSTIRGTAGALGYLLLFGVGTILGMTAMTGLLSLPFTIRAPRMQRARRALALTTGAVSLAFGLYLAFQIGIVDGLFLDGAAAAFR
jgi:high-affinity nickel-transport protein